MNFKIKSTSREVSRKSNCKFSAKNSVKNEGLRPRHVFKKPSRSQEVKTGTNPLCTKRKSPKFSVWKNRANKFKKDVFSAKSHTQVASKGRQTALLSRSYPSISHLLFLFRPKSATLSWHYRLWEPARHCFAPASRPCPEPATVPYPTCLRSNGPPSGWRKSETTKEGASE